MSQSKVSMHLSFNTLWLHKALPLLCFVEQVAHNLGLPSFTVGIDLRLFVIVVKLNHYEAISVQPAQFKQPTSKLKGIIIPSTPHPKKKENISSQPLCHLSIWIALV